VGLKLDVVVKSLTGLKKSQNRAPKPKKKQQHQQLKKEKVESTDTPFNNPLAEALIKSGFKT